MVMRSDKVRALLPQLSDSKLFRPASNVGEAAELSGLSVVFKSVGQITKTADRDLAAAVSDESIFISSLQTGSASQQTAL